MNRQLIGTALAGLALGYGLDRIGFSSWDEVNAMFRFDNLRLIFTFGAAVVVMALIWRALHFFFNPTIGARRIHPGTIPGGLLFGIGWAVTGACPSVALVQIGEGKLLAVVTLLGIFVGNWLYSVSHGRFFGWTVGSCVDD